MTFVVSLFVSTMLAAKEPETPPDGRCMPSLNLVGARLFIDDTLVYGPVSLQQTRFAYLYWYVPGKGLYTIAAEPFDGATQAGEFRDRALTFRTETGVVRLEAARRIVRGVCDAWVRHVPEFQLDVDEVLYGYGDFPSIEDDWRERFGAPSQ
jgi:hypothetical protein